MHNWMKRDNGLLYIWQIKYEAMILKYVGKKPAQGERQCIVFAYLVQ